MGTIRSHHNQRISTYLVICVFVFSQFLSADDSNSQKSSASKASACFQLLGFRSSKNVSTPPSRLQTLVGYVQKSLSTVMGKANKAEAQRPQGSSDSQGQAAQAKTNSQSRRQTSSPKALAFVRLIQRSLSQLPGSQNEVERILHASRPLNPFLHRSDMAAIHVSQVLNPLVGNLSEQDWLAIQQELSLILNERNSTLVARKNSVTESRLVFAPKLLADLQSAREELYVSGQYILNLPYYYQDPQKNAVTPTIIDSKTGEIHTFSDFTNIADSVEFKTGSQDNVRYQIAEDESGLYVITFSQFAMGISKFDKLTKSFNRVAFAPISSLIQRTHFYGEGKIYFAPESGSHYLVFDSMKPELGISSINMKYKFEKIEVDTDGIFLLAYSGKYKGLSFLDTSSEDQRIIRITGDFASTVGLISYGKDYAIEISRSYKWFNTSAIKLHKFDRKTRTFKRVAKFELPISYSEFREIYTVRTVNDIISIPTKFKFSGNLDGSVPETTQFTHVVNTQTGELIAKHVPYFDRLFNNQNDSVVFNKKRSGIYVGKLYPEHTYPHATEGTTKSTVTSVDGRSMIYYADVQNPKKAVLLQYPSPVNPEGVSASFALNQLIPFEDHLFAIFNSIPANSRYTQEWRDMGFFQKFAIMFFDPTSMMFKRLELPQEFDQELRSTYKVTLMSDSQNQNLYLIAHGSKNVRIFSLFKTVTRSENP